MRQLAQKLDGRLAIDLFSGGGGLSLGLHMAGFNVILAAEKEKEASETHRAHFPGASLCVDLSQDSTIDSICNALDGLELELVAGGPPCQPYSQAAFSKVRHLERFHGRQDDNRRNLWSRFIEIVRRTQPKAVLVENVPDMAFGRDGIVLRRLVADLEDLGYYVNTRVLGADSYGVPQHRQRLFTVAFRERRVFRWPKRDRSGYRVLKDAIGDLPVVKGGDKQERRQYDSLPSELQKYYRGTVAVEDQTSIYDHYTRAVRADDLQIFQLMDSTTRYNDLPAHLKRYRDDIFEDKYKRLDMEQLSRTITAHISQDGYWYIHPTQHRTLTIREAARIQTFPDNFRFCGFPRHAFKQIGEAVPPLLARAVGDAIRAALDDIPAIVGAKSTKETVDLAETWLDAQIDGDMVLPWVKAESMWLRVLGFILFERTAGKRAGKLFDAAAERWPSPEAVIGDERAIEFAESRFNADAFFRLKHIADAMVHGECPSSEVLRAAGLSERAAQHLLGRLGITSRRPTNAGLDRLASRYWGTSPQAEDGRGTYEMLLGRMVGLDADAKVYCALNEILKRFCTATNPLCESCPLAAACAHAAANRMPAQLPTFLTGESLPAAS